MKILGLNVTGSGVLRIGIGLIFVWFGVDHVVNVAEWAIWVPEWMLGYGMSAQTMTYLIGASDIVFGAMLVIGLFPRRASMLIAVQMLGVILVLTGFSQIGMRDLGFVVAALSMMVTYKPSDKWA